MKTSFAKIEDGAVVAVWKFAPGRAPEGLIETDGTVGVGFSWDGETFSAPTPPQVAVTEADVRLEAQRRLQAIGSPYSPAERETWAVQVAEAEAGSGPILTAVAAARGLTVAEMATLVLGKRDTYAAACGAVLAAQATILALDPLPGNYADNSRWP